MKILARLLLSLLFLCVGLIIIVPIAVLMFFDPTQYRSEISTYLSEKSGLPISIEGSLSLDFFPQVGIKAEKVLIHDEKGASLAKVAEIKFNIPVRELLQRHLHIETLTITGAELTLIKRQDGSKNWELPKKIKNNPSPENSRDNPHAKPKSRLSFALQQFEIQKTKIHYIDEVQKQEIFLDEVQMKGESAQTAFPLLGQFDFRVKGPKPVKGHSDFIGTVRVKGEPSANFHTKLNVDLPFASPFQTLKGEMDLQFNADKSIQLKGIDFYAKDIHITGNSTIPLNTSPITFALNVNQLNLDQLAGMAPPSAPATARIVKTQALSTTSRPTSLTNKNGRKIKGELHIQQVMAKNLKLQQVRATVLFENNLLTLNPITAALYQGKLNANIVKDLNQAPTYFSGKLQDIQIQPILKDLNKPEKITGQADIDFKLAHLPKGLEGTVKLHINQGVIKGIDVNYYLHKAQSLLKKETNTATDTKSTPFGDLTGTFLVHDNFIDNNDLTVVSPDFKANGTGSINLNNQNIEYKIQALRQYHDGREHPNTIPLALRIKGTLDHPKVEPDMDVYLKKVLERGVKEKLEKQIEKKLDKILKKKDAGESESGDTQTQKEQIEKKIEKELHKGLKKIFKL